MTYRKPQLFGRAKNPKTWLVPCTQQEAPRMDLSNLGSFRKSSSLDFSTLFLMWDKGMESSCCHNLSWSGEAGAHRTAQGGHPGQTEHQQAPNTSHPALVLLPCSKEGLQDTFPGPRATILRGMSPRHLGQAAQCPRGSAPRRAHAQPGAPQPEKNTGLKTT